jgi:type IV secretory pathway VirB10-like protein
MASTAQVFFAGVATTFAVLAAGFGGGVMLAKSALRDQPAQTRASTEPPAPARVILAATAASPVRAPEPAIPEQKPQLQPAPEIQAVAAPTQVEKADSKKADSKKAEREARAQRKRIAERKARKIAAERARRMEAQRPQQTPGILAFGGDQSQFGGFFGN